ncbi:MAG: helix-turn-helix transcriptional regulator [Haliscomenobacter sp.]|nr:helix-turn-helix transcriptional regulator [Haliscomenobacter sp.]
MNTQALSNPDLNLQELAGQLGISPGSLSKVITACLGRISTTSSTNIGCRKQGSARRPPKQHLSIAGIAFECGFNSKATFNRAFRKYAQKAPSEFLQSSKSRPRAQNRILRRLNF